MTDEKKKRAPRIQKTLEEMTPEERVIHEKQQEIKAIRAAKKTKLHDEAQARKKAKAGTRAELDAEKEIVLTVKNICSEYNALGKGERREFNVLQKINSTIN